MTETSSDRPISGDAEVTVARDAAARGAWAQAYDLFRDADRTAMGAADLEAFADSAWWTSRLDESMELRRDAYAAFAADGDDPRAGYQAVFLGYDHMSKSEDALANGWFQRAKRHLRDEDDRLEKGLVLCADADLALWRADLDEAGSYARACLEMGQRLGERDLVAMGLQALGRCLIAKGDVRAGLDVLDDAMVSVLAGELTPLITGWIYCNVLSACLSSGDIGRAGGWTDAARSWCDALGVESPYHGLCRVYRVEVVGLRGGWDEALAEATRAAEELATFGPHLSAEAVYVLGEIRRRTGDLAGAEEAFLSAHGLGRDPQPGLALVRLAEGEVDAAMAAIRLAVAAGGHDPLTRARLQAAKIEIALAAGDRASALDAGHELDALAKASPTSLFEATARTGRATLHLDGGEPERAMAEARAAWEGWGALQLPFEAARARVLMGLAAKQAGDHERARLELEAARTAFEHLGARRDAREAADILGIGAEPPGGLSAREVEVLRLVAAGKTNRQIATAMKLSEHTISRHLQNIFTKLGVSSRAAATAFAVDRGLVTRSD